MVSGFGAWWCFGIGFTYLMVGCVHFDCKVLKLDGYMSGVVPGLGT